MQWKVTLGGKEQIVQLPDQLPDNQPFDAVINGRGVKLKWQRQTNYLAILDDRFGSAWTSLNLRSKSVNKFPGESDVMINAEFKPSCAHGAVAMDASVSLFFPGQEHRQGAQSKKPKVVRSQITGKVLKVLTQAGATVAVGEPLLIIEAMKMENRVLANTSGVIESVKVKEGDTVSVGAELVKFKQN